MLCCVVWFQICRLIFGFIEKTDSVLKKFSNNNIDFKKLTMLTYANNIDFFKNRC